VIVSVASHLLLIFTALLFFPFPAIHYTDGISPDMQVRPPEAVSRQAAGLKSDDTYDTMQTIKIGN